MTIDVIDAFLCHNSKDKPLVMKIAQALENRGVNSWIDKNDINAGENFLEVIQQVISKTKSGIIFFGLKGVGKWQQEEISALQVQKVDRSILLIPILLPGVEKIPEDYSFLQTCHYLRLTSEEIDEEFLNNLVSGLSPARKWTQAEILANFQTVSAIGRNWLRGIDGKSIQRSELSKLIQLIEDGSRTILLTDRPGSGKTCVLLDLADYIEREKRSEWGLLFIKGDQFTNLENEQDIVNKGLLENSVNQCAGLTDLSRVVVIIDSLDVLSLNRQQNSLKSFLGIIDRLAKLDKVTVITACRIFDLHYDPLLRGRSWQHTVNLQPLDFHKEVKPFLIDWNVDISKISPEFQALLQIPQNLRIYGQLARRGVESQYVSAHKLYNNFIEEIIVKNPLLGNQAIDALQNMAERLMQRRSLSDSKAAFGTSEEIVRLLISEEVLLEDPPGSLAFSHQILGDCITVRSALSQNETLAQFILKNPQLPFIRPFIRAFFFHLRASQTNRLFNQQIWEVLSHNEIAYHIRRLVCESFAEIFPIEEDWQSLNRIFRNYPDLFKRLLWQLNNNSIAWWDIITRNWLPVAKLSENREDCLSIFVQLLQIWTEIYPEAVVAFWREALTQKCRNPNNLAITICNMLNNFKIWDTKGVQELLETLVENFEIANLGKILSQWINFTNTGDTLLWRYITKNVLPEDIHRWNLRNKLRCHVNDFNEDESNKEDFLTNRLKKSDILLNLVLDEVEKWGEILDETSWRLHHSQGVLHSVDSLTCLLHSLEIALKFHSSQNSRWWQTHEPHLRVTSSDAIRYFIIQAYKENIEANIPGIESQLQDEKLLHESRIDYEVGELMYMSYSYINELAQIENQRIIIKLYAERRNFEKERSHLAYRKPYNFSLWIPCIFRSSVMQDIIEDWQDSFGYTRPERDIFMHGGFVLPPLSSLALLEFSDETILCLLDYYAKHSSRDDGYCFDRDLIGGFNEFATVIEEACTINPQRFIALLPNSIERNLYKDYIFPVVKGITSHLRYCSGNLKQPESWKPVKPLPDQRELASTLLNWLERYVILWEDSITVTRALQSCCEVLIDLESTERLSLLILWVYNQYSDNRDFWNHEQEIEFAAINSVHGVVAESSIKLFNRLLEEEQPIPEMLLLILPHMAKDTALYVRFSLLQHLPFLMYKKPDLGWQLLANILADSQTDLWKYAEKCFYYQYKNNFVQVAPYLDRLLHTAMEKTGDIWGRISTLASLAGHISQQKLFETLQLVNSTRALHGATQVFRAYLDLSEHQKECLSGLITILQYENLSGEIISEIDRCFIEENQRSFVVAELENDLSQFTRNYQWVQPSNQQPRSFITQDFALVFLNALTECSENGDFDGLLKWLAHESRRDPLSALDFTEILVDKLEDKINQISIRQTKSLIVALNEIFREADETNDLHLIKRVIDLQDRFLKLNIYGIEELLNSC